MRRARVDAGSTPRNQAPVQPGLPRRATPSHAREPAVCTPTGRGSWYRVQNDVSTTLIDFSSTEGPMRVARVVFLAAVCVASLAGTARAQNVPGSSGANDWQVTVYPLLAWVPLDIGIDVNIPPIDGGGGGTGQIVDSQFDGAFFGGVAASNGPWRIEGYGLWASFGGDRPELPFLEVDLDIIYGSAKLGRRVAPDLYVTGGVRRVALDY